MNQDKWSKHSLGLIIQMFWQLLADGYAENHKKNFRLMYTVIS